MRWNFIRHTIYAMPIVDGVGVHLSLSSLSCNYRFTRCRLVNIVWFVFIFFIMMRNYQRLMRWRQTVRFDNGCLAVKLSHFMSINYIPKIQISFGIPNISKEILRIATDAPSLVQLPTIKIQLAFNELPHWFKQSTQTIASHTTFFFLFCSVLLNRLK